MPRTNVPGVRRLSAGKAPRKIIASKSGITQSKKGKGGVGGNPYHPRPTPPWQKEIKMFFPRRSSVDSNKENDNNSAGPSAMQSNEGNLMASKSDGSDILVEESSRNAVMEQDESEVLASGESAILEEECESSDGEPPRDGKTPDN